MADLAKLIVSLEAQTAKYQAGLERANRKLARFERNQKRRLRKVSDQFKKFGAAVIAALGTRALVNYTRKTLSLIDTQAKFAARIGLTQKQLAGLALAAETTGVKQNQLSLALQRATRRIAEAAQGTGEAKGALKELGLAATELNRLSPDEVFVKLAGAFENVTNQSDRVRLAFKLFDSEGVALVNTLRLGEDGIRNFQKRAEELGTTLEQRQVKNVEDANNALAEMGAAFQGLGTQITAIVSPGIINFSRTLTNLVATITKALPLFNAWLESITGIRREVERLTLAELELEFAVLTDKARELTAEIDRLAQQGDPFDLGGNTGGNPVLEARERELRQIRDRLDEIIERRKEVVGETGVIPGPVIPDITKPSKFTLPKSRVAAAEFKFENSEIGRELRKNIELFDELESVIDETATPLERLKMELADIRATAERNPLIDDELIRRQTELAVQAYQGSIEPLKDVNDEVSVFIAETWKQAARNIQDSFADLFFDPFDASLKDWARNLLDTVRRALAEIAANQLFQLLAGAGGGSGGLLGGAFNFIGGLFGRRTGGSVFPNQSYVVGESGPEIYTPNAAGRITPGLGGGLVFNMVTNVEAGVDASRLVPILEQNNRKLKGEIVDELDRGKYQ